MKQIIQSFKTGETTLEDIPAPVVKDGHLLIQTTRSLVSLGTEKMLVEFGKANLISKARQQPDKVKQVLEKLKSEGLLPTLETVFKRLEQPLALGYCNVGRVIAVGKGAGNFKIGDRVASNGSHAEVVCIPKNLVAKIPDNVSDEEAAFTVIGSIGLEGIRLCNPTFGETIVVFGLGLIGLLTAYMLQANGCNVIGIDLDKKKLELARKRGIATINPSGGDDIVKNVMALTNDVGADGVIITASAKTDEIIAQSAKMSRKRGRIILIGVIGLNISRSDFYEKELSFQVSCSYGPGRYDDEYEAKGTDYPLPYVRWTENRNFQAILQAISTGKLNVKELITERVPLADFKKIYGNIGQSKSIASIIEYTETDTLIEQDTKLKVSEGDTDKAFPSIGIIGAGNYTKMTLLPSIKKLNINRKTIVSAKGVSSQVLAKKYGFNYASTDYLDIINDPEINLVIITTRHNLHAAMVIEALNAGKHVFVEKPLALNSSELEQIVLTYENALKAGKKVSLTVGFNRRFSPHTELIRKILGDIPSPLNMVATMNAGYIPKDVWVHDLKVGGGRIIGEACHYIDLLIYLANSKIVSVCTNTMGSDSSEDSDNASILLKFENGSNGVINYFANGSKSYSKERIEIFSQQRTIILNNFKHTFTFGFRKNKSIRTNIDKGQKNQFRYLVERISLGGEVLIPFDQIINSAKASFAAVESIKKGEWIHIG